MLTLKDISEAEQRLQPVVFKTPLVDHSAFFPFTLYDKLENLQKTGAFKIRGAYNKISRLTAQQRQAGIICASAGNHAQGVAYAAQLLNIAATVVMPRYASLSKIEATRSYGVQVILAGESFEEAYNHAKQLQSQSQAVFIEPYDDDDIIAGQATVALEIFTKKTDFDWLLVPVGGGGLISGIALVAKTLNPQVRVIGVEAGNASSLYESLHHDKIITTSKIDTFADGIAVAKIGKKPFAYCRKYVDQVVVVNEVEINNAVLFALEKLHLLVEGAGAVGLAALLAQKLPIAPADKVVNIISGGNIDITLLSPLIESGLRHNNRKITFGSIISDTPGSLNKLLLLLADQQANIVNVQHDRYHHNTSYKTCYVEITIDTFDEAHQALIFESLSAQGYDYRIK